MTTNAVSQHPYTRCVLIILAITTFLVLPIGGMVRNLDAGLSCPDWPWCFGKIIPHFDLKIFAEWFHRLIVLVISILMIGVSIHIWTQKRLRPLIGGLAAVGVLLLFIQAIFGALTVLWKLKPEIVNLHLVFGTMYFATVILMTLRAHRPPAPKKRTNPSHTWRYGIAAIVIMFIQITLGGMVSSHAAGLACPDFPKCQGLWWPGLEGTVGFQVMHRIGALIASLILIAYIGLIEMEKSLPKHITWKARTLGILLVIQIILGVANVFYHLPIFVSVGHLAVAEAMFALVLVCTYEIRHFQLHQPD